MEIIKLDVGGKIFKTCKENLLSVKDTFFYGMLSSGKWLPDEDGCYFIDRNPKLFPYILDYLRYGKVNLSELDGNKLMALKEESDYYLMPELVNVDRFASMNRGFLTLSNNDKTVTSKVKGFIVGVNGISCGKRTWNIMIDFLTFKPQHFFSIGIIEKSKISYTSNGHYYGQDFGLSFNNGVRCGKYESSTTGDSKSWFDIKNVIQMELDCDNHSMKLTNLNSKSGEQWTNIPEGTYHLFIGCDHPNDQITILD